LEGEALPGHERDVEQCGVPFAEHCFSKPRKVQEYPDQCQICDSLLHSQRAPGAVLENIRIARVQSNAVGKVLELERFVSDQDKLRK